MTLTTEQLRARIGHLKERLRDMKQHKYPDNCPNAIAYLEILKAERQQDIALLEELLANREAQPLITDEAIDRIVVPLSPEGLDEEKHHCEWHLYHDRERIRKELREYFTSTPAPAVPDDVQHLRNVQELYHKQEERLFSLAQRIKGASFDKYSHTTAQAIDVLECEIFGDDGDACRAAMLDQPVSSGYKLPDGWIACSERMPASGGDKQTYVLASDFKNHYWPSLPNTQVGVYGDWFNDGNPTWDDGDGNDLHLKEVTHWLPLPAAPEGGNDNDTRR